MAPAEIQIANLLYTYAECIDFGDLEGAAALFANARIKTPVGEIGPEQLLGLWRQGIVMYDGVPRTKHLINNPIIEVDEDAGTATCRSTYTVMQKVDGAPLQPVICGRYHDSFVRGADGRWRFSFRDYSLMDLIGDMTRHSGTAARARAAEGG